MKRLSGKHAVITGGTRGIGRAIGALYAKEGAHITLLSKTGLASGGAFVEELQRQYPEQRCLCKAVDVSDHEAVQHIVQEVLEETQGVDILVNSAGITKDSLIMRMGEADWDAVINTNLKSVYNIVYGFLRSMLRQKSGRIIALSSIVGQRGNQGQVNYAASKAGLCGLIKSLAREVGSRNILVNGIAPGWIDTDMTNALSDAHKKQLLEHIPLGRMGTAEEVAQLALFLASDAASYITGQILTIDGGLG